MSGHFKVGDRVRVDVQSDELPSPCFGHVVWVWEAQSDHDPAVKVELFKPAVSCDRFLTFRKRGLGCLEHVD